MKIKLLSAWLSTAALAFTLLTPTTAHANFPMEGAFQATQKCPALRSIKKNTNPGSFFTQAGKSYPLKAKNKAAATHYSIMIRGEQRWIEVSCGQLPNGNSTASAPTRTENKNKNQDYLLTASWQAAFCQTNQRKTECRSQTAKRYDATHFSLHGLWPQPKDNAYCGVNTTLKAIDRRGEWHLLPALDLSKPLLKELRKIMPGAASYLQRHEWYKHGTCYSTDAETYYRDSLHLMQQLNDSAVSRLFADNIGRNLSAKQIQQAFDREFGKGMGRKVNIRCSRDGKLIGELWISLRGPIGPETTLAELMRNAPDVKRLSCTGGKVDPAGF